MIVDRFDSLQAARDSARRYGEALVATSGPEYNAALADYFTQVHKPGLVVPRHNPRRRSRRKSVSSKRNPPELRKVHAGLESAYLAAVARKDKTSRALAKRIKGPWVAVEKLLARGKVPSTNPKRRRKRSTKRSTRRSSSRRVSFAVKKGSRIVGRVVASSRAAAEREASRAGYSLGPRRKLQHNPPRGAVLSERAESITYQHDADGEWYKHTWKPGVVIKVSPDRKTVSLYRPDGKPVAGNFWVPNRAR